MGRPLTKMNGEKIKILISLYPMKPITEIARTLNVDPSTLHHYIRKLRKSGCPMEKVVTEQSDAQREIDKVLDELDIRRG